MKPKMVIQNEYLCLKYCYKSSNNVTIFCLGENAIGALPVASREMRLSLFNIIWNERPIDSPVVSFIYRRDGFVPLGMNDEL